MTLKLKNIITIFLAATVDGLIGLHFNWMDFKHQINSKSQTLSFAFYTKSVDCVGSLGTLLKTVSGSTNEIFEFLISL